MVKLMNLSSERRKRKLNRAKEKAERYDDDLDLQNEVESPRDSIIAKLGRRFGSADDPFRFPGDVPPPGVEDARERIRTTVLFDGTSTDYLRLLGVAEDDPAMVSSLS